MVIEGVGSEVEITFAVGIVTFIVFIVYYIKTRRQPVQEPAEVAGDRPPIFNPGHCPICMTVPTFGIETNCGHLYCGDCFLEFFNRHSRGNPLPCPICRQRIGLLFLCFSNEERTAGDPAVIERITSFVRRYNRMMTNDLTIFERLREIPILLRHFSQQLLNGEDLLNTWLRLRIGLMLGFAILYILIPYDIIPEIVYGIFGYIEDVLIVLICLLYFAVIYRDIIANAN